MLWTILAGLALALVAPWLVRVLPRTAGWLLGLGAVSLAGYYAARIGEVRGGAAVVERLPWVPKLGLELSFRLDGLSMLFALLICAVGGLVLIYAGAYLANHPQLGRLLGLLSLFKAAMLGLVLADNLLLLFVFWELTSLSSFFLIGFAHTREASRKAALQALLVTGLGGLCLLAGFLLLGQMSGSLQLGELFVAGEAVRAHSLYLPMLLLVLMGAFTKSAQFPFHFWLPAAMAAPTPVSAYLHSVTMVKAGIYLLLRLSPVLGGTAAWHGLLEVVGGLTMLLGGWLAVQQSDLKRILAFTTVSSLGTLVFLIGLDTPLSLEAALIYLLAHALYKGALFLVAGAVDHATGTRDITRLGGLGRKTPWLAAAALAAGLSMAGAPPLLGFFGKELFYDVVLMAPRAAVLSSVAAVVTSILMVTGATLVVIRPFFGRAGGDLPEPHPTPPGLALGPLVLALAGLAMGLFPGVAWHLILAPASIAVLRTPVDLDLKLWHGWTEVVALSALTLAGGAGLYPLQGPLRRLQGRWPRLGRWGPATWYDTGLAALNAVAEGQTRLLQNGRLRVYLLTVVGVTVTLVSFVLISRAGIHLAPSAQSVFLRDLVLAGGILAAAWICIRTGRRLVAVIAMGVIGYGVALIFVQFGAPDLAMTQFLIETMTVVLFALIVHRLPLFSRLRGKRTWWVDASVALASGALMMVLALVALTERHGSRLAGFFAERSLSEAHGRNIVNVILVDFRALDTLGEIIVLALAGFGVLALLNLAVNGRRKP